MRLLEYVGCDRRHDDCRAEQVTHIVLEDQDRPRASLLRAAIWIQVREINIPALKVPVFM